MSLGLDQPSASLVDVQPVRKSAGLAFLISLLVPGAGQMYCGKVARGGTTLAFFVLSVILAVVGFSVSGAMNEDILGIAMLAILVLYIFSFLDAYFVAREINAGTDAVVDSNNPRVATTLNLLTNGFGYWYLGERTKGWTAFVVLGLLMRGISHAMGNSPWSLLLLIIPCAMALDAYRIARKQMAEAQQETPSRLLMEPSTPETRLPAGVPVALACVLAFTAVGVIALGLAVPRFDPVDQTHAVTDQRSSPKRYENPTYGLRLLVPVSWEFSPADKAYMVAANKGQGCQVALLGQGFNPFDNLAKDVDAFSRNLLQKNANFRKVADRPGRLGNLTGQEVEFVATFNGNEVIQRYLAAPKGLALYVLVTTMASSLQQDCEPDANWIRQNISIQ
jgi:TM2 domain-containing membrane protein YozV